MSAVNEWFYIRSISTGNVVTANPKEAVARAQVIVTKPALNDLELWSWKGEFLSNKATGLVLDIRKGRLRLIEDTEICLYNTKPLEEAHNQLWGVRDDAVDAYGRPLPGSYIYSSCNNEWVLDTQPSTEKDTQKLVLFPLQPIDSDNQRWLFVPEGQLDPNVPIEETLLSSQKNSYFSPSAVGDAMTPPSSSTSSPTYTGAPVVTEFPKGLTPAKRGSHSSIYSMEAFKDYHKRVYEVGESVVSDKGIAMASAYHIFQNWKLAHTNQDTITSQSPSEMRSHLQSLTQQEVAKNMSNHPSNNKDSALTLSNRLIVQLYDQTPISP